jgi:hypothetical protein
MMNSRQQELMFHGAVAVFLGLLCGVPFGLSLVGNGDAEAIRAWRAAHLTLLLNGIWLLAISAVVERLVLSARSLTVLKWSLLVSAYAAVALIIGAVAGVRGLPPSGPATNVLVWMAAAIGSGGGIIAAWLTVAGARAALQRGGAQR